MTPNPSHPQSMRRSPGSTTSSARLQRHSRWSDLPPTPIVTRLFEPLACVRKRRFRPSVQPISIFRFSRNVSFAAAMLVEIVARAIQASCRFSLIAISENASYSRRAVDSHAERPLHSLFISCALSCYSKNTVNLRRSSRRSFRLSSLYFWKNASPCEIAL